MTCTLGPVRPHRLDARLAIVLCPHRRLGTPHAQLPCPSPPPTAPVDHVDHSNNEYTAIQKCSGMWLSPGWGGSVTGDWSIPLGPLPKADGEYLCPSANKGRRTKRYGVRLLIVYYLRLFGSSQCGGGGARRGKRGGGDRGQQDVFRGSRVVQRWT